MRDAFKFNQKVTFQITNKNRYIQKFSKKHFLNNKNLSVKVFFLSVKVCFCTV